MANNRKLAVSVVALLGVAACGSDTSVSESAVVTEAVPPDEVATTETETTETTEAPDVSETTEAPVKTEAPADDEVEDESEESGGGELTSIGKSGFSTWDNGSGETWANAGALVTNNSDEDLFGVQVTYNFIGADGTPVTTQTDYLDVIPAGDSLPSSSDAFTDLAAAMPVTLEITAFAEENSFFESDWIEMELGPATVTSDEYFSAVNGTVTNPADEPFSFFRVSCLLVDAAGAVVGSAVGYPEQVAPGQSIAWEAYVADGSMLGDGSAAECRSIAIIS